MTNLTWDASDAGDAAALDGVLTVATGSAGAPTVSVDLAADPALSERLGTQLARLIAPTRPGLVLGWLGPDEAVLAHIVARELGVPVARASLDLGRLTVEPDGWPSDRVALVATSWGRDLPLAPLRKVVGHTADVVAAAEIVTTDPGAGTIHLASRAIGEGTPQQAPGPGTAPYGPTTGSA